MVCGGMPQPSWMTSRSSLRLPLFIGVTFIVVLFALAGYALFTYAISREEVAATIGGSIGVPSYSIPQDPQGGWMSHDQLVAQGKKDGKDYV